MQELEWSSNTILSINSLVPDRLQTCYHVTENFNLPRSEPGTETRSVAIQWLLSQKPRRVHGGGWQFSHWLSTLFSNKERGLAHLDGWPWKSLWNKPHQGHKQSWSVSNTNDRTDYSFITFRFCHDIFIYHQTHERPFLLFHIYR